MHGTWDDLNRRLAGAILGLDVGDVLTVGEQQDKPRRGVFGGRPKRLPPRRWVSVTAGERVLIGECVGSTAFGGEWETSEEATAKLTRQGWEKPWSADLHTWMREAPLVGAPRMALACVRALQALGCELADLEVEFTREPD